MMDTHTLPEGWVETELGDISSYIQRGKSPKYTEISALPVINQKCVRWHGIEKEYLKYVHEEQWSKWSEERYLENLDILWNSTGTGTIGRACIYKNDLQDAVVDSHVTILRIYKEKVIPAYVFYFIMSPHIQKKIDDMQSGSTNQVELNRTAIYETQIPIAPLNEQRRIVSKIEELFSDLDQGEAALKKAQTLIATYRQSVLKAAVTGELTKDWREANKDHLESGEALLERILKTRRDEWQGRGKYKEPQAPDTTNLPKLPEGWVWVSCSQLISNIRSGSTAVPKDDPTNFPILRSSSVRPCSINYEDVRFLTEEDSNNDLNFLSDGDLLFIRLSGSLDYVGNCALVSNPILYGVQYPDRLFRAIPVNIELGSYLELFFASFLARKQIMAMAKSTAGHQRISMEAITSQVIPFPPLVEQNEIVSKVEDVFSQIAALETWCKTELARSATLRQAILKDAFSGKLVPQDLTDEPASILLERIKAEREAQSVQSKTKPKAKPKGTRGRRKKAAQLELL